MCLFLKLIIAICYKSIFSLLSQYFLQLYLIPPVESLVGNAYEIGRNNVNDTLKTEVKSESQQIDKIKTTLTHCPQVGLFGVWDIWKTEDQPCLRSFRHSGKPRTGNRSVVTEYHHSSLFKDPSLLHLSRTSHRKAREGTARISPTPLTL